MADWMIYGANGYTGRLIAQEAKRRGLRPILAGRSREVIELAESLEMPHRVFSLEETDGISQNLEGVKAVIHCAGPFSRTSRKMVEGCLRAGTHYLDITGEIEVFESVFARNGDFKAAGVTGIPGAGFDVVPTDCLAARLKQHMPDATHLALAIKFGGKTSPGTSKTMIDGLPRGGMIRQNGKLKRVATGHEVRQIRFDQETEFAVTIPWGDVSTAFYSTKIPNIKVFMAISRSMIAPMKLMGWLARLKPVKSLMMGIISRTVSGPSAEERETGYAMIWGEVRNAATGKTAEMKMRTPDGYRLTVESSLKALERVLKGSIPAGVMTPSQAFGADFILELPGIECGPVLSSKG